MPITWAQNDDFIDRLRTEYTAWESLPVYPLIGFEINYEFFTPATFEKWQTALKQAHEEGDDPQDLDRPFTRAIRAALNQEGFHLFQTDRLIEQTRQSIARLSDPEQGPALAKDFGWTPAEMIDHLSDLLAEISHSDPEKKAVGAHNLFLAFLHLNDPDEGGLRGLIEPRFGNLHQSVGWWDLKDDVEHHTYPISHPISAIENFYDIHERIERAAHRLGILIDKRAMYSQFHVSLNDRADDHNHMTGSRPGDITILKQAYRGFRALAVAMPFMLTESYSKGLKAFVPDIGTSRLDHLRQRLDTWEFRLGTSALDLHYPRIVWAVLRGMRAGLENDPIIAHADLEKEAPIQLHTQLSVEHAFDPRSAMASCLKHARLGRFGSVIVPYYVVENNLQQLLNELGPEFHDLKTYDNDHDYPPTDLRSPTAWQRLFKSCRVTRDNRFIVPLQVDSKPLHPEIRAALACLQVTGRRTVMDCYGSDIKRFIPIGQTQLERRLAEALSDDDVRGWMDDVPLRQFIAGLQAQCAKETESFAQMHAAHLSRYFAKALENEGEKPLPTFSQVYDGFIGLEDFNQIRHYLPDTASQDPSEPARPSDRQKFIDGYVVYSQRLRPAFTRAVKDQIAVLQEAGRNNQLIATLSDFVVFLETKAPFLSPRMDSFLDNIDFFLESTKSRHDFDPLTTDILSVGVSVMIGAAGGALFANPDIALEDIQNDITAARSIAQDRFAERLQQARQDNRRDLEHFFTTVGDHVVAAIDNLTNITKDMTCAETIQGPEGP